MEEQLSVDRFDNPSASRSPTVPGTVRVGLFKIPAETESKQSSKRKTKSRPKVWEKVAWFTRRSKSGKEGKSTPESTRKGNENRLTVDELSVTRASSLKKTNSVRKTKSFCNLKRRKETELTVGIGSNLHERDLDTRHIGDCDTATGTFHDFSADRRVPGKVRMASSNNILSEIAREMNCPLKDSTKSNIQSDHCKSSLAMGENHSKASLRFTSDRYTPDPVLVCSKETRSSNLKCKVRRTKSFSGPFYNSWPRKKRSHVGLSPKDQALSPPVKQKRLGHGGALKKTATFSGFDSFRLIPNEHLKVKRICKSTPYLLETNHIQNQSGFQTGVIHFYKSPKSGQKTNDKAKEMEDVCRTKSEKMEEKKDRASETDAPHLYLENHLCYDRKSSLQQGMENLHMSDKELLLQCVTKSGNAAVPKDQVLCDILVTPPSELYCYNDEDILNNAESIVRHGHQLEKNDSLNSSDEKSESHFADINNGIEVTIAGVKQVNGILTTCSAIRQDSSLAHMSDSTDFKQIKNKHTRTSNHVQSLSSDKSSCPGPTSEGEEIFGPSQGQVSQNTVLFSSKSNVGTLAKLGGSGCELHVTCKDEEQLEKNKALSDQVCSEFKISNLCSQDSSLSQECLLDMRFDTADMLNQGSLCKCIASSDNLQGDCQIWNEQYVDPPTALCTDTLFSGISPVTDSTLVCAEADIHAAVSDVAINGPMTNDTTSSDESCISGILENLEGQGYYDENEEPSLTFHNKGKERENKEFASNQVIPQIVCTHIDSAMDRVWNTAGTDTETSKPHWNDTHASETATDITYFDDGICEGSMSVSNSPSKQQNGCPLVSITQGIGCQVESDGTSSIKSKYNSAHLSRHNLPCIDGTSDTVGIMSETSKSVRSDIHTSETNIVITHFEDKICESNVTANALPDVQQEDSLHTSVVQDVGYYIESESTSSLESKCSSMGLSLCDSSAADSGVECSNSDIDGGTEIGVASHSVNNIHELYRKELQFNQEMNFTNLDCINTSKTLDVSLPKVEGSVFKEQVEEILRCFEAFNHEQRNIMLRRLLERSELPQMHMLSVAMEPLLHKSCPPNCQDMMAWLPYNVTFCIMSLLDPVSLCRCGRVNRNWNTLASNPVLWQHLCRYKNWELSRLGEQKQMARYIAPDGSVEWKKMFAERFLLRQNWLNGKCKVRTFEGHAQGISCVQFDDSRIVSGSSDKTIKVWDIHSSDSNAVLTLAGHSGTVRCLNLNGNRLVSGSTDRSIKVWDLSFESYWSGASCKVTMVGHMHTVRCLQVDDEKVVSGSYDKTLKVWDIKTGQCRLTLRGHNAAVLCVQFDEKKIVSGSYDKTIKVWSLTEGSCLMTLTGHHDAVTCLNLTFDGRKVISGSLDHNLKFWDLFTGKCIGTLDWIRSEGHTGVVRCLQADSWRIVSAGDDKTLKVWCLETGQRLLTLRWHTDGVTCLHFNDHRIVSGSYDKTVKLWDFTPIHGFLDPQK